MKLKDFLKACELCRFPVSWEDGMSVAYVTKEILTSDDETCMVELSVSLVEDRDDDAEVSHLEWLRNRLGQEEYEGTVDVIESWVSVSTEDDYVYETDLDRSSAIKDVLYAMSILDDGASVDSVVRSISRAA